MQYLANLNQISEQILSLISDYSNSSLLLDDLVTTLGKSFQVDACIAVVFSEISPQNVVFSWWHNGNSTLVYSQHLRDCCVEIIDRITTDKFLVVENQFAELFESPISSLIGAFSEKYQGGLILIKSEKYNWKNYEKQQLKTISKPLKIAFSQIALQEKIAIQNRYQSLLSNLSNAIAKSSDLKLLFNLALSEINLALKISQAQIITVKYKDPFFVQRKRQQKIKATLTVADSWTERNDWVNLPEKFTFQLTDSLLFQQALAQAPQALVINQEVLFPDLPPESLAEIDKIAADSLLLITPLMGKTTSENQPALVLGFLVLQRDFLSPWHQAEIDLIHWVSVQLSTALIHHQTLTQVQSIVEERTSQLQWSLDVQAKLSEKMRQHIEQLKTLNELKDDFLSSMSHELKTPMTSMKMAIEMLRQNIPETMRTRYLDILEQEWNREYNLIKDLLTLQQVESGELTFKPQELQLNQIVANLALSFQEKWYSTKGLNLDTHFSEPDLRLSSDFDSLNHILTELLLNAAKYSEPDTAVSLTANSRQTLKGKEVIIIVENYGVGIEPNELPYIFDKFRRGKGVTDRAVPGTGLGLTLVKHLVEHLNGTIDVTSQLVANSDLYQTTFTITLPQQ